MGIITYFSGSPGVTVICAAVILLLAIIQLMAKTLHSLNTYIIAIVIGGIIGASGGVSFLLGACLALCIEDLAFQIIGLIFLSKYK